MCIQIRSHADVLNVFRSAGIEVAVAAYSGEAEEILVFQISPVAPAEHLECDQVFPWFQVFGQIEFGFKFAVFTVADELSVHPKIHV